MVYGSCKRWREWVSGGCEDVKGLEEKMMEFIELSYEEKKQMGEKSREVMEKRFDKEKVVEMTLEGLFR